MSDNATSEDRSGRAARGPSSTASAEPGASREGVPGDAPRDSAVVTHHRADIGGSAFDYTATAGTVVLRQEREGEGEKAGAFEGHIPHAEVFFVAYTRDDVADVAQRPVTFAFNGGPGSSSVWLHLGAFGPERVAMGDAGLQPAPPYRLEANPHSLLDISDLVFIDPVSTGYSRPVAGEKAKDFLGFDGDLASVAEFIRLWCSRNGRWMSPTFLAGESYGTTRAAGLAGRLQTEHGLYLNGVMLVSSVLEFATLRFTPGNDLPPLLFLPSYAATAHFHGRLEPDLQKRELRELLDEVEAFCLDTYAGALLRGDAVDDATRREVAEQIARFTGLDADDVLGDDLRIDIFRFTKALRRDEGITVGRLDSRVTGVDRTAGGATFEFDPSYAAIQGAYTAAFNHYVRQRLGYENDLPYEVLSMGVNKAWSYADFENRYVDVAETLRTAMAQNPYLKVHVANGYYDLATPYFATLHTFRHLGLPADRRDDVSMSFYEAGHMMYTHPEMLARLKGELAAFVADAV